MRTKTDQVDRAESGLLRQFLDLGVTGEYVAGIIDGFEIPVLERDFGFDTGVPGRVVLVRGAVLLSGFVIDSVSLAG
ncbi:MAG: hypothetical protein QNJ85_15095 [Gammaproteobacteria bacterium]|nr:hypothetical protein [Gammaproteobacteria bacterium]